MAADPIGSDPMEYARVHGVKRTKRNQVVRVVREHYLREDLPNPVRKNKATRSRNGRSDGQIGGHDADDADGATTLIPFHGEEFSPSEGARAFRYAIMDASCFPFQVWRRNIDDPGISFAISHATVLKCSSLFLL